MSDFFENRIKRAKFEARSTTNMQPNLAAGSPLALPGKWEKRYPAIIRLWENAWAEFVPFLQFDREIRTVICTTNAIESINARLRRAVNARGHFPTEQAALKCLYLAIMSLDPTGKGRKRWTNRWKAALNAFDITFDGRLSAGRNLCRSKIGFWL
jgi:putative transposase